MRAFNPKQFRGYLFPIVFLIVLGLLSSVLVLLFAEDLSLTLSEHKRLHRFTQLYFHGIVLNRTTRPIQITEFEHVKTIPPGKTSLDIGVSDADSILISYPTEIEGHLYTAGVFKFCDLGILAVEDQPNHHLVRWGRRTMLCKLFKDMNYYPTIQDAFERPFVRQKQS